MNEFLHHFALALPLFLLVLVGFAAMRISGWPNSVSDGLTRFVFALALPAMLFRLISHSRDLPPVDSRLLIAFFGGCFVVFVIGRLVSWKVFGHDGIAQSVFALGCIFSNNVMLGLPIAKVAFGDAAVPSVALVLVFNALILWTLLTVSIEWARHGSFSPHGLLRTMRGVLANPIIVGILSGALVSYSGWTLPEAIDAPISMLGQAGAPMALIALGMGLAEYGIRDGWRASVAICVLKLVVLPFIVWVIARLLGLPRMETQVAVLLSSMAIGANVYLMSRQFRTLQGATASGLVLSTLLAAFTTPVVLALLV